MDTVEEMTDPIVDTIETVVEEQTGLTILGVVVLATVVAGIGTAGYFIGNKIKSWNEDRRRNRAIIKSIPPKE